MIKIPKKEDINVHNSLDEIAASEHFLGLDVKEAELLFIQDSLNYQWDLLWMGPNAFNYYIDAALNYLKTDESTGDVDFIDALCRIIETREQRERQELMLEKVLAVVEYVIENYEKYEVNEAIYVDLKLKFENLKRLLI